MKVTGVRLLTNFQQDAVKRNKKTSGQNSQNSQFQNRQTFAIENSTGTRGTDTTAKPPRRLDALQLTASGTAFTSKPGLPKQDATGMTVLSLQLTEKPIPANNLRRSRNTATSLGKTSPGGANTSTDCNRVHPLPQPRDLSVVIHGKGNRLIFTQARNNLEANKESPTLGKGMTRSPSLKLSGEARPDNMRKQMQTFAGAHQRKAIADSESSPPRIKKNFRINDSLKKPVKTLKKKNIEFFLPNVNLVRTAHSIKFPTRKDFELSLAKKAGKRCDHIVLDQFPTAEKLLALCGSPKNKVVYLYPEETLTHVETFYIDVDNKRIVLMPDSLLKKAHDLASRCPPDFKPMLPAAHLYLDNKCFLQRDFESCSFIAWQTGNKLERMNEAKAKFREFDNQFLNGLPEELTESVNGKNITFTRSGACDDRFAYYDLPENFWGMSQYKWTPVCNRLIARKDPSSDTRDTEFPSHRLEKFTAWTKWFSPGARRQERSRAEVVRTVEENGTTENYSGFYKQKTSPIREELSYRLRAAKTADQYLDIASEAFSSLGQFPTDAFMERINACRRDEGRPPFEHQRAFHEEIIKRSIDHKDMARTLFYAIESGDADVIATTKSLALQSGTAKASSIAGFFDEAIHGGNDEARSFAIALVRAHSDSLDADAVQSILREGIRPVGSQSDKELKLLAIDLLAQHAGQLGDDDLTSLLWTACPDRTGKDGNALFDVLVHAAIRRADSFGAEHVAQLVETSMKSRHSELTGLAHMLFEKFSGELPEPDRTDLARQFTAHDTDIKMK